MKYFTEKELENYEKIFETLNESDNKEHIKQYILIALKNYIKQHNPLLTESEIKEVISEFDEIIVIKTISKEGE